MKKYLILNILTIFGSIYLNAQNYKTINFSSGLNADVIANGENTALASTTNAVDGSAYAYFSQDFKPPGNSSDKNYALPNDRIINSPNEQGLRYILQDYNGSNSLRLTNTTANTLVFSEAVKAKILYVLVTSGDGASTLRGKVNFTNGESQDFTNFVVPDWFNSTNLPVEIKGIGRVQRTSNSIDTPTDNPRMYQQKITINESNLNLDIASVTFQKQTAGSTVPNIFAITANLSNGCANLTDLTVNSNHTTANLTWISPGNSPGNGYEIYYSNSPEIPNNDQQAIVTTNETSVQMSNLDAGKIYYFWVRTACDSNTKGDWIGVSQLIGTYSVTYTGGDILTDFASASNLTIDSPNNCSGHLNINVPEGYKIASVQTVYDIQARNNTWINEQRSLLISKNNNQKETELTQGVGNSTGTYHYDRSGISIANGLTGTVGFELRAWRTYGGTGCNDTYQKVLNNTWKIIITYVLESTASTQDLNNQKQLVKIVPNPASDFIKIDSKTKIKEYVIYSQTGQKILSKSTSQLNELISISQLNKGIYVIQTIDVNNQKTATTFIKK